MLTHRKEQPAKLVLRQREQHVGLVLPGVDSLEELEPGRAAPYAGVVAGRDVVGVQEERPAKQEVELDLVVAGEAGVRSAAPVVLAAEVFDDVLLELALEVHDVVGNAYGLADAAGVVDVLDRAAALAGSGEVAALDGPEAHGDAHDIVALPLQQQGGHGGVYAPAHGDDHAPLGHGEERSIRNWGPAMEGARRWPLTNGG